MLNKSVAALALALISYGPLSAQSITGENPAKEQTSQNLRPQQDSGINSTPDPTVASTSEIGTSPKAAGQQPKRIFWIIPNFRTVDADTQLPPLSTSAKFLLATKDSFDYSSLMLAGVLSGVGLASNSQPQFGQGAKGYGRYYAHFFADGIIGNYLTEAIVPSITHEDPRYYTLGHGGPLHRAGYAVSRLVVTKTDSGHKTFNFSEILGNGMAAGVSNLYYPQSERTWTKTYQKWATQIAIDSASNLLKEFWPDISNWLSRRNSEH